MRRPGPTTLAALAAVAIVGLLVALAILFMAPEQEQKTWTGKTLRVGYAEEYPFAFRDASGRVTGEAPETARAVLSQLGVTDIQWVLADFSSLIPRLEEDDIDMIAAGMFATPERAKRIDFSLPTVQVGQGLLVRAGNPKGLSSYDETASRPDVVLAVLAGSVEEDYLKGLGIPGAQLFRVPDAATGVAAVTAGRADGLALSAPTVNLLARGTNGACQAAAPFTGPITNGREGKGQAAFGFRKDDTALRERINGVLADFVGSPRHLELIGPFGFSAQDMPGDTQP
ncbi:ectoine/hydroxyectoine ABC transporter substrate-binding protein EhuB [Desulfovibrio sulfodismutans]|uniref:Ectoine/hydroxyectoine ABC transporter substrate-binding protein EhuB n=1 Tax=Desulfolutivibrio sulfodismutans TaxID=63561 RepID=A0A7K3NKG8_9BACT|nr:ectoine/hydroxyectoine ABC transporter substrate-binding protein EhuB [Desulfolutivibrio sulfodismutans]NDY56696.1 ectoine/hydroxyectoine ABC transporter substrate-binding protein EhuB [Desulfolutivibrio sulfodismutans]QLA13499.1 ectoine/hydroxyectoine ABC transporter substrate-binding protein EhuB [Desulfolutivibrio sulfodismutans DSM 3696]